MGRYYSGDIEGKFWFGVQSSGDADNFGVMAKDCDDEVDEETGETYESNYIYYEFEKKHLPDIKEGIEKCNKALGKYKKLLKEFFKANDGYNDVMIESSFNITTDKARELLKQYARVGLGEKILKCVKKTGCCNFTAEC